MVFHDRIHLSQVASELPNNFLSDKDVAISNIPGYDA
jgi:hypothetical protein